MRKTISTLLLLALFFMPFGSYAQNQKIKLSGNNITLKAAFEQIETQTGISIAYDSNTINIKKLVSPIPSEVTLNELMTLLLQGTDCDYVISKSRIIVSRNKKTTEKPDISKKTTGIVTDSNQESIIGVRVIIKGTDVGTITDTNGQFLINAAPNAILTVSSVGYVSQDIKINGRTDLRIILQEDDQLLDEVVVVGYGTQKKVNLTGAVSQITGKEIENRPVANMSQLLQGMSPNMNVTFSSGRPGASGSFNIRGGASIASGAGAPLILVDGIESSLDRISTRDVESISVLKDASASAVYGARASFGVILVTTKQGTANKTTVSYGTKLGRSTSTTSTDFETRGYYSSMINDKFFYSYAGQNYTKYTDYDYEQLWLRVNDKTEHPDRPWVVIDQRDGRDSYTYYGNTDWYNYLFDDSRPSQEHSLNISGGNDKMKYYLSGSLFNQKGVFRINPDKFRTYNFRSKITTQVSPWLEFSNNSKYYHSDYTFPGSGSVNNLFSAMNAHGLASFVPINPDGTPVYTTSLTNYEVMDGWSALLTNNKHNNQDKYYEFSTTFEAIFKLFSGFDIRANYSYSHLSGQVMNRRVNIPYSKYPGEVSYITSGIGIDDLYEKQTNHWYNAVNVYANYQKTFNNSHNLTVLFGGNYETKTFKDLGTRRQDLLSTDLNDFNLAVGDVMTITGGQNTYKILGSFYRINYDYSGKYLLEVSGRVDGSSRFMRGHRFGFFPSSSIGWRISEENFFEPLRTTISNLKLRASYGSLGNQQVVGYYDYIQTINTGGTIDYSFNDGQKASSASVSAPNASDLTWEVVSTTNVGLDLSLFKNRLDFSGDIYTRSTKGMLAAGKDLPSVYGAAVPKMNLADLRTNGWELSVAWKDKFTIASKPFNYSARFILSDYISTITKFDNPSKALNNYYEGQRLGEIWGYVTDGFFSSDDEAANYPVDQKAVNDIINSSAGSEKGIKAGDLKFVDLDGDNIIRAARTLDDRGDQQIIGNSLPRYSYGINLGADWGGFDFSVFLQGVGQQHWYPNRNAALFWGPYSRPYSTFIGKDFLSQVWSEENPNTYFPRPRGYIALNNTNRSLGVFSDRYLQDLAYLRIKNLNIGYTFPTNFVSKALIQRLRIYFSGENLHTFTKLKSKYIDPEQASSGGANGDAKVYGWSKTFSVGLDITF